MLDDEPKLAVRHLLHVLHFRPYCMQHFRRRGHCLPAHFVTELEMEMTLQAHYVPTALLLCAQSEIEIVETAIAQSSSVAKQAQVSVIPSCSRRPAHCVILHCYSRACNQLLT